MHLQCCVLVPLQDCAPAGAAASPIHHLLEAQREDWPSCPVPPRCGAGGVQPAEGLGSWRHLHRPGRCEKGPMGTETRNWWPARASYAITTGPGACALAPYPLPQYRHGPLEDYSSSTPRVRNAVLLISNHFTHSVSSSSAAGYQQWRDSLATLTRSSKSDLTLIRDSVKKEGQIASLYFSPGVRTTFFPCVLRYVQS